jgi:7-cyano-7-deazaguanine tRNA-ribosyltransferase
MRAHNHPALLTALKRVKVYEDFIEKESPTVKQSGFFFFDNVGLSRPEIAHYRKRLESRYQPPKEAKILILMPQTRTKPFHRSEEFKNARRTINRLGEENANQIHVCFYVAPFGVVPVELDEIYPLSQHETAMPMDCEVTHYVASQVANYLERTNYMTTILITDPKNWGASIEVQCKKTCTRKGAAFEILQMGSQSTKLFLAGLESIINKSLTAT